MPAVGTSETKFAAGIADALAKRNLQEVALDLSGMVIGLMRRVERLESAPRLRFLGIYEAGYTYTPGNLVVRAGGLWHCNIATNKAPGTCGDWQLATKSGSLQGHEK